MDPPAGMRSILIVQHSCRGHLLRVEASMQALALTSSFLFGLVGPCQILANPRF